MNHCPCGLKKNYNSCCGIYHSGTAAPTPKALMRSRYTAYTLTNMDYIQTTMQGKALQGFVAQQTGQWANSVVWLGLEVLSAYQETESKGFVEFIARFMEGDKIKAIHEISEFHFEHGRWFYVDGLHQSSVKSRTKIISRNAPCPCRSGKKFKSCHGLTPKNTHKL